MEIYCSSLVNREKINRNFEGTRFAPQPVLKSLAKHWKISAHNWAYLDQGTLTEGEDLVKLTSLH
jgi:hypothetical protein